MPEQPDWKEDVEYVAWLHECGWMASNLRPLESWTSIVPLMYIAWVAAQVQPSKGEQPSVPRYKVQWLCLDWGHRVPRRHAFVGGRRQCATKISDSKWVTASMNVKACKSCAEALNA